jgi:hypothetical protein
MTRHNGPKLAVLFLIFALPFTSFLAARQEQLTCPRITKDHRPALLFADGSVAETRLCVAYMDGNVVHGEPIVSAKYLDEITQLDNSVFFISTTEADRSHRNYVVDLDTGTIRLIARTNGMRCLRAEPARKTAMLIDVDGSAGEIRFLELRLASLQAKECQMLSRASLGDEFNSIFHRFKISPDFRQIAYLRYKGGNRSGRIVERISEFELKSMDLQSLNAEVLDDSVRVEIPGISSFAGGAPPFDWISNHQVLYQDMIYQDQAGGAAGLQTEMPSLFRLNGLHVFKTVDIGTGVISEHFRKQLRMALDGGSLEAEPLTGRLIFNRNYVLDHEKDELIDRNLPFSVFSDSAQGRIEIRSSSDVLYSGKAICMVTRLSASRKYFAYLLSPEGNMGPSELFAVFDARLQPVKVVEGPYSPTQPIGWIE